MPEGESRGVSVSVVAVTAAVSAVLGAGIALGGFLFFSSSDPATPESEASAEMSPEAILDQVELDIDVTVDGVVPDATANSSVQDRMKDYVSWSVSSYVVDPNRKCSYREGYLDVQINVTNLSGSDILAGEASVAIQDLFGNEIMLLDTPIDARIPAGSSTTIGSTGSTCWSLGNFRDELRLKEMPDPYSSTKLEFYLSKLALDGGEVVTF